MPGRATRQEETQFLFRLGLIFFDHAEATSVRRHVAALQGEGLPWTVVEDAPYDALLLARGPRLADPEHVALLRLSADMALEGSAMAPIALPRPLSPVHLRSALEAATASLTRLL